MNIYFKIRFAWQYAVLYIKKEEKLGSENVKGNKLLMIAVFTKCFNCHFISCFHSQENLSPFLIRSSTTGRRPPDLFSPVMKENFYNGNICF